LITKIVIGLAKQLESTSGYCLYGIIAFREYYQLVLIGIIITKGLRRIIKYKRFPKIPICVIISLINAYWHLTPKVIYQYPVTK
jgi:hypothetical protein